jgi:hypothetical protein
VKRKGFIEFQTKKQMTFCPSQRGAPSGNSFRKASNEYLMRRVAGDIFVTDSG